MAWTGAVRGEAVGLRSTGEARQPRERRDRAARRLGLVNRHAVHGRALQRDRTIDGRNIEGLLSGRESASPHEVLFFFNANVIDGVRGGRWKYYRWVNQYMWPLPLDKVSTVAGRAVQRGHRYTDPQTEATAPPLTPLLFDLTADMSESYNVIAQHPDDAARLHAAIEQWERELFANPRAWK